MEKNFNKRTSREVTPETREKIKQALKSYYCTHKRDPQWCKKISDANKQAWAKIPKKTTNTEDLI